MPDPQRPLLHLHGRPRLVRPGAAAQPLQPDGRHRLLLLLAVHAGPLTRAQACALLWPDTPAALARSRLRKLVFLLAKDPLLEGAPLDADGAMLGWRVDTDLRQADDLERQGALAQALALTALPLAEGFDDGSPFGAWLLQRRQREQLRWRERLVRALTPPASLADAQALAWIDDALMHEPFDEPLVRERLRLIARRDGPVAARLAYEQWSDAVRAEFGQGAGFDLAPLLATPAPPVPGPLPQPASRFFGRAQELAMLDTLLPVDDAAAGAARLVCLWGPPGAGKTRLALQWARQARARGQAAALVALEALDPRPAQAPADPRGDDVLAACIASACGWGLGDAAQPVQGLLQHLRERAGLVLVVDNIDHRLGDRPLLARLLRDSPVRLLVASRTRLGLAGETTLPVGGLAMASSPEAGDALSDAECLLVDRAGLPAAPDAPTRQRLQELGRLAQGQPLALELAARQARRLGLAAALQRLQHDIAALEAVEPDLPARQRSLRATFDSVVATLAPAEREAMSALAPLRGDFELPLAAAALGGEAAEAQTRLDALVDRSLLAFDPRTARYRWHPFLREFALLALDAQPARALGLRLALAEHVAGALREQRLRGTSPTAAGLAWVAREWPHVLDAWRTVAALRRVDLWEPLSEAVALHAEVTAQYRQGSAWLELPPELRSACGGQAVEPAHVDLLRAWLLHWVEGERALDPLSEAEPVLARAGDIDGQIAALRLRGIVEWRRGDAARAEQTLQTALDLGQRHGHTRWRAILLDGLGLALEALGRYDEAQASWLEALMLNQASGNAHQEVQNLINLAIGRRPGEDDGAVAMAERALALAQAIGYEQFVAHALATVAWARLNTGEPGAAAGAARQAREQAHGHGDRYVECWALALCARAALALGQATQAAEWAAEGLELAARHDDLPLLMQHAAVTADWARGVAPAGAADALAGACAAHPALHVRLRAELRQRLGPAAFNPGAEPWPAPQVLQQSRELLRLRWLPQRAAGRGAAAD